MEVAPRVGLFAAMACVPSIAAADRIVIVGAGVARPVADALRLELDPFDIEVVAEPEALAADLADENGRREAFHEYCGRVDGTGVADVGITSPGRALVLYCERAEGITRSREVAVADPPGDQDFRALALVLRAMIRAPEEPEDSPPSPAPSPEPRPVPVERARRPPAPRQTPRGIWTASAGWALWTRLDGDFVWHGPALAATVQPSGSIVAEVRAEASLESEASAARAHVTNHDVATGLAGWLLLRDAPSWRLAIGAGIDLHALSSVATHGDRTLDRFRLALVPIAGARGEIDVAGPFALTLETRMGWATNRATYSLSGKPVIEEGSIALEVLVALALRL